MKNSLSKISGRLNIAEERISELENKGMETFEKETGQRLKKIEEYRWAVGEPEIAWYISLMGTKQEKYLKKWQLKFFQIWWKL